MSINHRAIFWVYGILIFLLSTTNSLSAANLERRLDPEMGCVIEVSGSITLGDTDALRAMLQSDPVQTSEIEQVYGLGGGHGYSNGFVRICFDSPGGSFQEAIEMALFIQTHISQVRR